MEKLIEIFKPAGELIQNEPLHFKGLFNDPIVIQAEKSFPFESEFDPMIISIGGNSGLTIQLFNDEDDKDDLGFLSTNGETDIHFDPTKKAYLKYDFSISAKSTLNGNIKDLGFDFKLKGEKRSIFYKSHINTVTLKDAILNDLTNFRTVFKKKDIESLEPNDALCFRVEGSLKSSIKFSWSDIISQGLNQISSTLSRPITLDLILSPKLTASFDIDISDQFSLLIKKIDHEKIAVSVCKVKNSQMTGGVGASLGIEFSDPKVLEEDLKEIIDKAVASITKKSKSYIAEALKSVGINQADAEQLELIGDLADLFGLTGSISQIDELKQKWEVLLEKIETGITQSAKLNASLTFGMEYKRIKEGKEILKVSLPSSPYLDHYHSKVIKFNLKDFVEDLSQEKIAGAVLENYFNQKTLIFQRSWGFGLNLFGKELLKGKDFNHREEVDRYDIRQHLQKSLRLKKGYQWKLGKESGKWFSDLGMTMDTFSIAKEPVYSEMDFNWCLQFVNDKGKLNKKSDLRGYLDLGVIWGSILEADTDRIVEDYFPVLNNKSVTFEAKLIFPDHAIKNIFSQVSHHGWNKPIIRLMALSLGASMRYLDDFPVRRSASARESAYAPIWVNYLESPDQNIKTLANTASSHLQKVPNAGNLPKFEKKAGTNQGIYFADVIFTNPNLYKDLISCIGGMTDLGENLLQNKPISHQIDKDYNKLKAFLSQSIYIRALGSFLNRCTDQNMLLKSDVQKVFTISYEESGEERTINLAVI